MWHQMMLGTVMAVMPVGEAGAYTAYVSNEKSNTISVIDTATWKLVETTRSDSVRAGLLSPRIKDMCWSRSATTTPSR